MQRGDGIGSILGKLFRFAIPLIKHGARVAKPHLIRAGKRAVKDVIAGKPLKQVMAKQAKRAATDTLASVVAPPTAKRAKKSQKRTQVGSGRRRGLQNVHMKPKRCTKRKSHTSFDPFV